MKVKATLPILIFSLFFLSLANWHIGVTSLSGLFKEKATFERINDQELSTYIQDKTGITVSDFYIINSDKFFGGMSGLPNQPIMQISKGMYEQFSRDKLKYVVLHETGHLALWHPVREVLIDILVISIIGIIFFKIGLSYCYRMVLSIFLGLCLGVAMIQVMRIHEWQADAYALNRLENPEYMIDATEKLKSAWQGPDDNSLTRKLFYRGIPYSQRIKQASIYL